MATLADQNQATQKIFNDTWGPTAASEWATENAANNPGSGGTGGQPGQQNQQLQDALKNMEAAINSGNQRQYDLAVGQLMGVFNGQPTLGAQDLAEKQREANQNTMTDVLKQASSLTGPKDYGQFMTYTGGGRNLLQQVQQGRPANGAPTGAMEPMTPTSMLQRLGLAPTTPMTGSQSSLYDVLTANNGSPAAGISKDVFQNFLTQNGRNPNDAAELAGFAKSNANTGFGGGGSNPGGYDAATLAANPGLAGTDPAAAITNPGSGQDGDVTGNAAGNAALLQQLGLGAPTLDATTANRLNGYVTPAGYDQATLAANPGLANPAAPMAPTAQGLLNSPTYRGYEHANQGDASVMQMEDYERGLQALKDPNQMDPAHWDSLGPVGQSLWTQAASRVFGWDPIEYQRQIEASRPLGSPQAPQSVRTAYASMA